MVSEFDWAIKFATLFRAEHASKFDAPHEFFELWQTLLMAPTVSKPIPLVKVVHKAAEYTGALIFGAFFTDNVLLQAF